MSAEIDRFLATGDAAKKKKPAPATIRRVGLRCTNCGGSHNTRDCPYEKKQGGLHNEDGTKIRVCSVCHKPGHTKRNCPELANFGTHDFGGALQLYAACYDCVVADNKFGVPRHPGEPANFGLSNWGRNPHGTGWQPNLNVLFHDNQFGSSGPNLHGCGPSCSDPHLMPAKICKPPFKPDSKEWAGCPNNGTYDEGRDCAEYDTVMGSYLGETRCNAPLQ